MERRSKLQEIRARGVAFPNHFRPADYSQDLHDLYDNEIKEDLEKKRRHCIYCRSNDVKTRDG